MQITWGGRGRVEKNDTNFCLVDHASDYLVPTYVLSNNTRLARIPRGLADLHVTSSSRLNVICCCLRFYPLFLTPIPATNIPLFRYRKPRFFPATTYCVGGDQYCDYGQEPISYSTYFFSRISKKERARETHQCVSTKGRGRGGQGVGHLQAF